MNWQPTFIYGHKYEIGEDGKVRSIHGRWGVGKVLKTRINRHGYEQINLWDVDKMKTVTLHRLVATAFLGNPDNLPQINHKDGNKENNHVGNLEWISQAGNQQHARRTGLYKNQRRGEGVWLSKLDESKVKEIRQKYVPRLYGFRKLAIEYGVDYRAIWSVIHRETWRHVI